MNLDRIFKAKSIAIYGASTNPEKIGSIIFYNLISSEYEGRIYPINPKYEKINGYKCYKDAASIKDNVDLAIMAIPAEFILDVLADCHKKGIKSLAIISAGFSEAGDEGKILEDKMIYLAEKYGIEIFGPNSLGMVVTGSKMNASFAASNAEEGGIALISQSGAICTSFLDLANVSELGFSHLLSIGNKSMINENHFTEYFLKNKETSVIGAYLEEFQDGNEFINLKNKIGKEKPIVVMSPGVTDAAKDAIKSHTGSLSTSHSVIESALDKYGIMSVNNISQMFNLLMGFEWVNCLPDGNRVGIITNAGGVGILATDALVESGLEIAKLSNETIKKLEEFLPPEAHASNPIDVIGDARTDRYRQALDILADADEVDSIFVILTPQLVTEIEDTAKLLATKMKNIDKPVIPVFLGGEYVQTGIRRLNNNKLLCFNDLNAAVFVLDKITEYADYLDRKVSLKYSLPKTKTALQRYAGPELAALPEHISQDLADEFELTIPKSFVVNSAIEAVQKAKKIGYPVVIKASTEDVVHKTDLKAIYLNINDDADLTKKSNKLLKDLMELTKRKDVGFLIQQQVKAEAEVFIGIKRDDSFGRIMLFGTGGIYTEVYKDISQAFLPLSKKELTDLVNSANVTKIIDGFRGLPKLAKDSLIANMMKIQKMVLTYPEIAEIDINPAMMTEDKCYLADIKIFVKK